MTKIILKTNVVKDVPQTVANLLIHKGIASLYIENIKDDRNHIITQNPISTSKEETYEDNKVDEISEVQENSKSEETQEEAVPNEETKSPTKKQVSKKIKK